RSASETTEAKWPAPSTEMLLSAFRYTSLDSQSYPISLLFETLVRKLESFKRRLIAMAACVPHTTLQERRLVASHLASMISEVEEICKTSKCAFAKFSSLTQG